MQTICMEEKTGNGKKTEEKIHMDYIINFGNHSGSRIFNYPHFFYRPQISSVTPSDNAVVETEKGMIRGSEDNGIYQYLGVPYAQAEERFVPTVEIKEWTGVLDVAEVGTMSPQSSMLGMPSGGQDGADNNCQNLNIWTPGINDGEKRA